MIRLLILSNQANYVIIFFPLSESFLYPQKFTNFSIFFSFFFSPFLFTQKLQWLLPIQFQDTRQLLFQNENQILICLQWMFWKLIENQVTCHRNDRTEQQICGKGFYIQVKEEPGEQSTGRREGFSEHKGDTVSFFFSNPKLNHECNPDTYQMYFFLPESF